MKKLEAEFKKYIRTFRFKSGKFRQADSDVYIDPKDIKKCFNKNRPVNHYQTHLYFRYLDFNKDIEFRNRKEVNFGIRYDDNFFIAAILPIKYIKLPLPFIIKTIYPKLKKENVEYKPDYIQRLDNENIRRFTKK